MPVDGEGDKPTFTAEELSHISSAGADGDGAAPAADKGVAAADKGGDKGAAAADAAAKPVGKAGEKPAGDAGKDAAKDAGGDDTLLGGDDEEDDADGEDGKEAAKDAAGKDGKGEKDGDGKPAAQWREDILKVAEAKWLKKAGKGASDETKAEIGSQVERLKKQLGRYGSLEAAAIAGMEAQDKLRAGQKAAKPGKDGTPEEVAAYREANGLPKAAEDITIPRVEVTAPDGSRQFREWTDADKPLHDAFRKIAFEHDLTQAQADALVKFQVESGAAAQAKRDQEIRHIDRADKKAARGAFKEEFGEDTDARLELVDRLLKGVPDRAGNIALPEDVCGMLREARTGSGHLPLFHPSVLALLSDVAINGGGNFQGYGEGAMIGGGDGGPDVRTARKAELTKIMNEDIGRYRREKNAKGQTLAEEMLDLQRKEDAGGRGRRAA